MSPIICQVYNLHYIYQLSIPLILDQKNKSVRLYSELSGIVQQPLLTILQRRFNALTVTAGCVFVCSGGRI